MNFRNIVNTLPVIFIAALVWYGWQSKTRSVALLANSPSESNRGQCDVVPGSVHDGDTMRVNCEGRQLKLRFCGIDAPELKQPLGIESRNYLRSLLNKSDNKVFVYEIEKDRYGRSVAELFSQIPGQKEELFINAEMLKAGMAFHYKQYSKNCHNYDSFEPSEEIARSQKLGVWRDPNFLRPWDYRKANRG